MALDKPYLDVPGTTIFDADQSRKGYWLNQFCMSLMKAENRERFKANERAYLDEWAMTEDQKQAVLARDVGIRFKGVEKTNVEEYCVSEGWIRLPAGKARTRTGRPVTITKRGEVTLRYEDI